MATRPLQHVATLPFPTSLTQYRGEQRTKEAVLRHMTSILYLFATQRLERRFQPSTNHERGCSCLRHRTKAKGEGG
ncbi:hypothetical protein SJAG_06352 [Schizosaccharomyces japonicus yFS275]|uniref:Uncharacterized protein n=1 Tax=Schizosaccharomyces japonicus (strain yFS275 / FY16936) TaxID=402676 RepID=T0S336_SCHJY|nr:hypothetical protein SJAG_06352 [Schizosaccharomyces japonicus yFS275]EQC53031.1 hypothetical protein SJAG_06352 [Schizosaccharomyces japonicus yFS275]